MRVVGYNLRDLLDDRAALTRVVHAVRPDVLCAQEVPRFWFAGWRLRRLARALGLVLVCGGRGSGGTAVLVAPGVRVLAADVVRLPVAHRWTRTRGAAVAVLDDGNGPVRVASVHLPLEPALRLDHVRRVLDHLRVTDRQRGADHPTVVVGDLNEPPDGPAWVALAELVHRDAAAVIADGPGGPGGAGGADGAGGVGGARPTFPARGPHRRIDAVLLTDGLEVTAVRVGDQVPGVSSSDLEAASDHLPLVVYLHRPTPDRTFGQERGKDPPITASLDEGAVGAVRRWGCASPGRARWRAARGRGRRR